MGAREQDTDVTPRLRASPGSARAPSAARPTRPPRPRRNRRLPRASVRGSAARPPVARGEIAGLCRLSESLRLYADNTPGNRVWFPTIAQAAARLGHAHGAL